MSKFKLFVENLFVYGLGGAISKAVPLLMLPIVTRLMPTTGDFAVSDLSNTLISLCAALAIMGMYDAMYRMFFDKEDPEFRKEVCSTALAFTLGTSALICLVMCIFQKQIGQFLFDNGDYGYIVYIAAIATLVGATNSIVSAPTRMQNKRVVFVVMNTIGPVLSYAIAIPLLLNGHYIIALPLAGAISAIFNEAVFFVLNHKFFSFKKIRWSYLKPLLIIAVPLIPNFLIYWLFNSADKLMTKEMLGLGAEGIYSVAAKLGQVSQLIYTAFTGGWQFFAFSTMKEKNQVRSNSLIFEYLGIISFACSAFVFALSYPIFLVMFDAAYLSGFISAPYLFLAPLMQLLFQVASNQFLVVKKTWPNLLILSSGALVNVVLNFFLIPVLGIEGASIATLVGYLVSDIICVLVLCKMKLMVISPRFVVSFVLTGGYIVLWRFFFTTRVWIGVPAAILLAIILVCIYFKDIKQLLGGIKNRGAQKTETEGCPSDAGVDA